MRLHYAWKYPFLRPPTKMVVERYNKKHHTSLHDMLARKAEAQAAVDPAAPSPSQASPASTLTAEASGVGQEGEEAVAAAAEM